MAGDVRETTFSGREALKSRRGFILLCGTVASTFFTPGCALFGGAFHSSDPEVDRRAAEQATNGALKELERSAAVNKDKRLTVCFIGVTGGPNAENLSNSTREFLQDGNFKLFEKDEVNEAFDESGVSANNVFIPAQRKRFVEALGTDVDFLLAGYIEKVSDDDDSGEDKSRSRRSRTVYRLELVNVETNQKSVFVADL